MEDNKVVGQTELDQFVDSIMAESPDFQNLDAEVAAKSKIELLRLVGDKIKATMIEHLPESSLEEFNQLMDSNAEDNAVQDFFQRQIPNLEQVIAAALVEFRAKYLGV